MTDQPIPVGSRVRFTTKVAWYERIGCIGVVVAPPSDGTYPQPDPGEVVVLLDADPLKSWTTEDRPWTCITSATALEVLNG